jgi:transposase
MDIHKNARLSFRSREALVQRVVERALTLKAAAAAFSVTVKTANKWVQRYRAQGQAGLYDRSSRPHRSPRRLPDTVIEHVIHLRRHHTPGYQIARRTAISPASISRILRRARLSRWRDLHPAPPVVRYEHPAPGDLLHLDIKGMTRFQQVSWRADGRRRGQHKHPGWEALHVAIDDHSRLAFTQILPDQKTHTTIAFLRDALDFFARHGIRVRALLTDNGSSYRSHQFRHACQLLGLKHRRTRPYSPRPTAKPNALSRPPCANGPTPLTGAIPTNEIALCLPGPTTTTASDLMVASTTSRPSAALNHVQRLEHLQAPVPFSPL